jgi:hypothetical protein
MMCCLTRGNRQLCGLAAAQLYEDRRDLTSALKVAEIAAAHGQCEDARERLLWQVGARETEPAPTPIQQPPQHPNGAQPTVVSSGRISDWGYRSGEADGPFAGSWSHQYSWWNDWCQGRFGELWTNEADHVADNLADEYWFYWPWPSAAICPTCGQDFWNGDVRVWAIQAFGPVRYCMDCCYRIRNGDPRATWFEHEVKAALQELRAAFGAIPAQSFSAGRVSHDGPLEERDRRIRALLAMPSVETIKRVLRQQDWLGVLRAARLVGDGWRPSRGTWCHASDGHRCRSLLEKAIDDWFTASGISHQCEPRWPRHPDLNPSGAKRADWLLQDGTYVECAGMLESKDYAGKIALKQRLARTLGIPLIVVAPTDMHRLGQIFGRQLGSDRPVLSA